MNILRNLKLLNRIPRISKQTIIVTIPLILVITGIVLTHHTTKDKSTTPIGIVYNTPTPTPTTPEPTPKKAEGFGTYTPPKIAKKDVYTIFMVGDSMTEQLGEYGGQINESLNKSYKSTPGRQRILIDNYATGSTNIQGLQEAMKQKKVTNDRVLDPLLSRKFDVLLIESFGYNPLSQLGMQGGLDKQIEILDALMKQVTASHPDSVIIFVATIAPNKANYGKELSPGNTRLEREAQAKERMAYIENHINYAKSHNIPLIDIYNKSLTWSKDGDLAYINPADHIHPSEKGVEFISREIADYIYKNEILPR